MKFKNGTQCNISLRPNRNSTVVYGKYIFLTTKLKYIFLVANYDNSNNKQLQR